MKFLEMLHGLPLSNHVQNLLAEERWISKSSVIDYRITNIAVITN